MSFSFAKSIKTSIVLLGILTFLRIANVHAEEGCPKGQLPYGLPKACIPISSSNVLPLDVAQPMRFEAIQMSVPIIYLQATGTITNETPTLFKAFLQSRDAKMSKNLFIHSPGGNLLAGLELGELIRRARLNTFIGHSLPLDGAMQVYDYPSAICASACAYAFLGGVTRDYTKKDVYGLHRFGNSEKQISGDDAQVLSGIVAKYIERMGVDLGVLEAASSASFESDIFVVPAPLAKKFRIIFDASGQTSFNIEDRLGTAVATFHFTNRERQYDGMIECFSGQRFLIIFDNQNNIPAALHVMKGFPSQFESDKGQVNATGTYFGRSAKNPAPYIAFSIPQLNESSFEGNGLTLADIRNPAINAPAENNDAEIRVAALMPLFMWEDAVNLFLFKIAADNGPRTLPIVFRECRK